MRKRPGCLPVIMVICVVLLVTVAKIYVDEEKFYDDIREETVSDNADGKEENGDGYKIDWDKLPEDCVAWIRFKHPSVIQYPVMKGEDNQEYLHRNTNHEYSYSGSIFMDWHNSSDLKDDNTIIYGHNMANETMFGKLKVFKERSYWKKHNQFYLYTRDGYRYKYKIYNVVLVNPSSKIYVYRFGSEEKKEEYIADWSQKGLYDTGILPDTENRIVTLSTCQYHGTKRLVIQGYLVEEKKMGE